MIDFGAIFKFQAFAQVDVPPGIPLGEGTLWGGIIPGLLKILLFLALVLSIVYLIWGGISWIMSGGNKEGLESARKKITYAILGLVLTLLSFAIIYTFGIMFGVNFKLM